MNTYRTFSGEMFFAAIADTADSFEAEFRALFTFYETALAQAGFEESDEYLLRFHLSDVNTQYPRLRELLGNRRSFISIVGQPPAGDHRIAMEVWLRKGMERTIYRSSDTQLLRYGTKCYQWSLFRKDALKSIGSQSQMDEEFRFLESSLARHKGSVAGNTVRTWIYCRDVDNNYAGLVRARRDYFDAIGLTADTRYIASTGIEGQSFPSSRLTAMDALSLFGHQPEQVEYMHAPTHLSPTHLYGVTFERGCRLIFGDRSHYYLSGTASIDKEGKVVHHGNVEKQTERMLENVGVLMRNHGGTLNDLMVGCIYLRDCSDAPKVRRILECQLPRLPLIYLRAPVCRPDWLVEMEAFGINEKGDPRFAPLL